MNRERRGKSFYILAALFAAFVLFLYGPIVTIVILSFQGKGGGLTFPMRGFSFHWFHALFQQQMVGDFVSVSIMGGGQSASVGIMIQNEISLLQYPAAAANSVILLAIVLIMVFLILRVIDIRKEL